MKKILILSFLAVGAATWASAATITVMCPTSGGSGASGMDTVTCPTMADPVGAASLGSIVFTYTLSASFAIGAGSVKESFDVLPAGSSDAFNGAFDQTTARTITDTSGSSTGQFTILNPRVAEVDAALGGLQIADTWTTGQASFQTANFSYEIDVNYTPGTVATPEPATLGLLGSALFGLTLLARRRVR